MPNPNPNSNPLRSEDNRLWFLYSVSSSVLSAPFNFCS